MASRADVSAILKEGGRGSTSRGINLVTRGLVVVQVVVTCILLIGSLLQMRSIRKQQTIDYGYDTGSVLSARMGLMDGDYPTSDARKLFFDRLVRELRTHADFEAVALTNRFRMVFSGSGPVEIEGREYKEKARPPERQLRADHPRLLRGHEPEAPRGAGVPGRRSRTPSCRWPS